MNYSHFLRVEWDGRGRPRHYVVHTIDPKFAVELAPDREAPNQIGRGAIKRLRVPNSWTGDYGKCAKLVGDAQDFFAQSLAAPVPKAGSRRC